MTSRRPGTAPSGTGRLVDPESPAGTGQEQTPRLAPAHYWPPVLVLVLLIILGMAGLRGAVTGLSWNGPLVQDRVVIGVALEIILGILLVITLKRRAVASRARRAVPPRGPDNVVAAKLRWALILVLGPGMIAVLVAIDNTLHLRVHIPAQPCPSGCSPPPHHHRKPTKVGPEAAFHFPLTATLYGFIVVLVAAVLFGIWWSRRFRIAAGDRDDGLIAEDSEDLIAEDSEDLREAVESGRSVLRTVEDVRAAIIACYVAMEDSLAERGAARAAADTPDELLARATRSGIVRGPAAERLTALFYEARFSSHPLDGGERAAAEQALDELAAALAEAEEARATP
jgi:uncharacterized membrane protein YedE/YeeE